MLIQLFKTILGLSISASFMIGILLCIRMIGKGRKLPLKQSAYVLVWMVILFRLCLPFSFETFFYEAGTTPAETVYSALVQENPNKISLVSTEFRYAGKVGLAGGTGDAAASGKDAILREAGGAEALNGLGGDVDFDDSGGLSNTAGADEKTAQDAKGADSKAGIDAALHAAGWIWAVGTVLLLLWTAFSYVHAIRNVNRGRLIGTISGGKHSSGGKILQQMSDGGGEEFAPVLDAAFQLKRRLKIGRDVSLRLNREGYTAVFGILHPVIFIDEEIVRLSNQKSFGPEKMEFLLAHELVHIKSGDNLKKLLARICLCLHWFNLLVWIGIRCIQEDIETACDEKVLELLGHHNKKSYAQTIFTLAEKQHNGGMTVFSCFGKHPVVKRIQQVLWANEKAKVLPLVCVAMALFLFGGCLVNPVSALSKQMEALSERYQVQGSFMDVARPYMETHTLSDYVISGENVYFAVSAEGEMQEDRLVVKNSRNEVLSDQLLSEDGRRLASSLHVEGDQLYYFLRNEDGNNSLMQWDLQSGGKRVLYETWLLQPSDQEEWSLLKLGGEGDYLTWFEGSVLMLFDLSAGAVKMHIQTNGNQDFASMMDGYISYQWEDTDTEKTYITRIRPDEPQNSLTIESQLGKNTFSVYANENYIIYKEDFRQGAEIQVYDVKRGESHSLWSLLEKTMRSKEIAAYKNGTWGINLMKDKLVLAGAGNSLCYVDLEMKRLEEVSSGLSGIGFYQPKNFAGSFSVLQYGSRDARPLETGYLYSAQVYKKAGFAD